MTALIRPIPVGYAQLQQGPAPVCITGPRPVELARLYLEQSAIGASRGAALMQACLEEAERLGQETIWLGVWEENARARALYRKWSFEDVGRYDFHYCDKIYSDPAMARPVRLSR